MAEVSLCRYTETLSFTSAYSAIFASWPDEMIKRLCFLVWSENYGSR